MNYKGYRHLNYKDRLKIEGAIRAGAKVAAIAEQIGVCKKTIYNELERGKCVQMREGFIFEEMYCADVAERKYQEYLRAKGPAIKLGNDFAFAEFIEDIIINKRYSPGAALAFIREKGLEFETKISETTLYNYIYRGDVFMDLTKDHLLYKGKRHKEKEDEKTKGDPKGESIENRPEEVKGRETFGHWEMDSLMGPVGSKAALLVLTERMTRHGIVIRVPDHTAASVVKALDRLERKLGKRFRQVFKTITVDNGTEFSDTKGMERSCRGVKRPRTKIYYCHPHSPNERASNENMNRILRRFWPKGTNFDDVTADQVAEAETWMNNYPRYLLDWKSSQTLFNACMATI